MLSFAVIVTQVLGRHGGMFEGRDTCSVFNLSNRIKGMTHPPFGRMVVLEGCAPLTGVRVRVHACERLINANFCNVH